MLQSVIRALSRIDRSLPRARPASVAPSELLAALAAVANRDLPQMNDIDAAPADLPAALERHAPPPPHPDLRAELLLGGVAIACVLNSGEIAIAESHAHHLAATKAVRVSERPGPARADRLIAQLAAQIDRADVSIRWSATALTQVQWDAERR